MIRNLTILMLTAALAWPAGMTAVTEATYAKLVASQKGKVVLVNFWATYCVPCRAEMPALVKLQQKYGPKGLVLMTISADEPEDEAKAGQFLSTVKVPAPHYLRKTANEDAFVRVVDAKWSGALPLSLVYDKGGKKVKVLVGEADLTALEALIQKMLL
ncbi:MAG: TlpA family protein disulfide reductase [Bryobacterales bacterium]|nr:TlpA family protein disulfide reductase [Bryobacterales bacterium]